MMLTREEATRDIRDHFDDKYLLVFIGFYAASSLMSALFYFIVALSDTQHTLFAWIMSGLALLLALALGAMFFVLKGRVRNVKRSITRD